MPFHCVAKETMEVWKLLEAICSDCSMWPCQSPINSTVVTEKQRSNSLHRVGAGYSFSLFKSTESIQIL